MALRHVIAAITIVACLGSSAAAQLTPQQAQQQFNGDLADALKNLKTSLASAKAMFFADLAAFETLVKSGGYDLAAVTALFEDLQTMMGSIGQAVRSTGNTASLSATDALSDLAAGGDLGGVFPAGFYPGDGGSVDVLRAATRKAQDKTIAAVAKRLKKTRALVEKQANVGMTVALAAPGSMRDIFWDEDGGFFYSNESPITCDALIGVSDLGAVADGVVYLGGTANPNLGDVSLELLGPESDSTSGGAPAVITERWSVSFTGDGLEEGVYAISATQGTGGSLATGSIGVR